MSIPTLTEDRTTTYECFCVRGTYRRKSDRVDGVWPENTHKLDHRGELEEADGPSIHVGSPQDLIRMITQGGKCDCPKCQGRGQQNIIALEAYVEAPNPRLALEWFYTHYPQETELVELWDVRVAPIKIEFHGLIPTYPTEA